MLSIGITICDKDYKCLDSLLKQIEERVKVDHEVIIIDNRKQFKDEKTSWIPTYSFGYNAYQFSARAKIIELAKGDYIWFIDGDDEVGKVDKFDYTEDIIAFSYAQYPITTVHIKEDVFTENLFNYKMVEKIKPALWNKFIKKSLFDKEFIKKHKDVSMITGEDTIWVYEALKHAESIRTVDKVVYYQHQGLSNRLGKVTYAELESLVVGFEDMKTITAEVLEEEDFINESLVNTYKHVMSFVPKCDEIKKALELMMNIIPKDEFRDILQTSVYPRLYSSAVYKEVVDIVAERYGKDFPFKEQTCMVTYEDGHTEEYKFVQTIDFEEVQPTRKSGGKWKHNLSVVMLVYDGNTDFLNYFTGRIKSCVNLDYELIIVDNRNDKTFKLEYKDAVIVTPKENVGILEGRRLGFEASKNDYIWFVDIDDDLLSVVNQDYGESDLICFPFFHENALGDKDTCCIQGLGNISKDRFYDMFGEIGVALWNKWIKRDVLEEAYKQIPHFFCIFNEDNIVTLTLLSKAQSMYLVSTEPIYQHKNNEKSITTRKIDSEDKVDILFVGFDEAIAYQKEYFKFCKNISYENPYTIEFYLKILDRTEEEIKPYFLNKLYSLFGKQIVDDVNDMRTNSRHD